MAPHWVSQEAVFMWHEQLLAQFGGSGGLRDRGLLDSALARPRNLYAYGKPMVFSLSASYAFGLAKNHAFIDGNKRVAFLVAVVFLELNGKRFCASEADSAVQTLALAAGDLNEEAFASWLEKNSQRDGSEDL